VLESFDMHLNGVGVRFSLQVLGWASLQCIIASQTYQKEMRSNDGECSILELALPNVGDARGLLSIISRYQYYVQIDCLLN